MDANNAAAGGDGIPVAPRIAVLIPCRNEATAIAGVVGEFRAALPQATIYVYDNDSSDDTGLRAAAAGAIVRHEHYPGKGSVMRRMFADVEADVYVLVDGDGTYDASAVPAMVAMLWERSLDLVNGNRVGPKEAYRPGHRFGNWLFSAAVSFLFGRPVRDVLTGLRVLSRRFVKSFPAVSPRFEIEIELVVHALELRLPIGAMDGTYRARPPGSASKLSSIRDGLRVALKIAALFKDTRPFAFFGAIGALTAAVAIGLAVPLFVTYFETGFVPRLPTGVLVTGMMLLAFLCVFTGLILDSVARGRKEAKRLAYLAQPSPLRAGEANAPTDRTSDGVRVRPGA